MAASMAIEKTFVSGSEEPFISEDSDCIFDMRSQRSWKRSLFGDGNFEPTSLPASKGPKMTLDDDDEEDPSMDEDYKKFLYTLEKYSKEQSQSLEEEEDEDGYGYMDPQYSIFMENLREDGKSYMLEISREDTMTLCIKYEGEEDVPSGGNGNNWATPREEDESNSAIPGGEDKGNSATPGASTTTREEDRRNLAIPREEDWKILAAPIKEDGRNSASSREEDRRNSAAPREEDRRDSVTSREKRNAVRTEDKQSPEVPHSDPKILKEVKMQTSDPRNIVSNGADGGSGINSESYQLLLNRRKLEDIAGHILAKSGKRLKCDNNDGEIFLRARKFVANAAMKHEDDDDGVITDSAKLADTKRLLMNSATDVQHTWHAKKTIGGGHSQFRENLMKTLRMPCNQREYEELWHEITDRKPMQRHRDLRGRIKIYDAGPPGKSYLDHYSDLAKKINVVRFDRVKVLNLLRGFFYWLTNLSHQGAFRPWLDSSCLEVEPLETA